MNNRKGITLIALVLTIIILLILAGISINMIAGQDGILNKALQSKEATIKAQGEEKLNLMMAEYQLSGNKKKNLKDYVTENLPDATVVNDSNSECVKVDYNNERYIITPEGNVNKISLSKNLLKNNLLMESWAFEGEISNNKEYLTNISSKRVAFVTNEYIEIDPTKKYYQSATIKSNNEEATYYIGIMECDVDKKNIDSTYVEYKNNTLTELTQDLKNGDTEIHIKDISNFENNNRNGIIFWNYKDSTGYEYPELTYSRNVYVSLFDESGLDKENNIIKLKEPWNYGEFKKETKLCQSQGYAGTFNYGCLSSKTIKKYWNTYSNIITGSGTNKGGMDYDHFRPGTKYIKPVILINYTELPNVTTDVKDILFQEIE